MNRRGRKVVAQESLTAPPQPDRAAVLSPRERFAAIVHEFVTSGGRTDQVAEDLNRQFPGGRWTRESIYAELRNGIASGYVSVDTVRSELGDRLRERAGLRSAAVIATVYIDQVAALAARRLLAILADLSEQRDAADGRNGEPVRIGFASGHTMSRVARALASLMRTTDRAMPKRLQFHALSSTFDVRKLDEDPNFFLARFDEPEIASWCRTEITFVGLAAPSLIKPADLPDIRTGRGMADAIEEAGKLDIVVTGASDLTDERSTMFEFYEEQKEEKARLIKQGCAGHLLYLPVGPQGPIDTSGLTYVMPTVLGLDDLAQLVRRGARVMLVSGPIATFQPKRIVSTILGLRPGLVSDVVIDERTGAHALSLGSPLSRSA